MEWLGRAGAQDKADPPYSAVTSSRKLWEYHLDRHHSHVVQANAVVDHFAPKCQDPRMQRVQESSRRFHVNERQAEIGRENRKLVDRLASISTRNCGGGCGGPPPGASRSSSQPPIANNNLHEPLRRRISKGIQHDNEQLVKRILAVKPSMNIRGMERDFKKHAKYSQNLRRMPESPPRRGRKPRSLPPLHERMRPTSDLSRPPEGLLLPGDLCRLPRSESGPASVETVPSMPMHSQSASTLREPLPRPEVIDSDDNVSPLAATEPSPSLPGSPGPAPSQGSPGPAPFQASSQDVTGQDSFPVATSGSQSEGVGLGRPPRPDSGSRKGSHQAPVAPQLERKESEMSDQQWQQLDKETERRSWLAGPQDPAAEQSSTTSGAKPGKRRRPGAGSVGGNTGPDEGDFFNQSSNLNQSSSMNKSNYSGTSDSELKYEDDWDEWSQDSPSKTGSQFSQSRFS